MMDNQRVSVDESGPHADDRRGLDLVLDPLLERLGAPRHDGVRPGEAEALERIRLALGLPKPEAGDVVAREGAARSGLVSGPAGGHQGRRRRDWTWVPLALGMAAAVYFLLLAQSGPESPEKPVRDQQIADDGPDARELERSLAALCSEDFEQRRAAFLCLLRGGDKAEQILRAFKSAGDPEQDRLVKLALQGLVLAAGLPREAKLDSSDFWRPLWEMEARLQSGVWGIALDLGDNNPLPGTPPSPLLRDVLEARHGAKTAAAVREHWQTAFEALKGYRGWGGCKSGLTWAEHYAHPKCQRLLDAVVKAAPATVPVILRQLGTPLRPVVAAWRNLHKKSTVS